MGDLFAHEEDAVVAPHLLSHGPAEGLADLERGHQPSFWSRSAGMVKVGASAPTPMPVICGA
jgi:hypothetical protein